MMSTSVQQLPDETLAWPIAWAAVVLLAMREGLRLIAYQCQAGVWTIGWGETAGVREGMVWTKVQADAKLLEELNHYAGAVRAMCKVTPNANQLGAMVSLSYNIGLGGLASSTVLKRHNDGDFDAAARAFGLFNQFKNPKTGKLETSNGLTIRRAQEKALYLTPVPNEVGAESQDMPQAVAPEKSLAASPIAASGAVTIGSGALSLLSGVGDNAEKANGAITQVTTATHGIKGLLAEVDLTPLEAFGGFALVAGAVVVWMRLRQRMAGWA